MLREKKIIFVCANYGGGIGKMLRFVMNICVNEFKDVLLLHRGKESKNDVIPQKVKEIILPFDTNKPMLCWRIQQICAIKNQIRNQQPDIVCCFGSEIAVMTAVAMIGLKNVKLIQAERGDPYTLSKIWAILAKWAFNRADNCVFQLEKQGLWYGENVMKRSVVIPNPFIPTGEIVPFCCERKKTIVSVGRFVPEKRYEILIEAFKLIHDKHPEYRLILYGEGPSRNKYEQLIKEKHLFDFVEMPGYTNDAMSSISDAGIFVLSSLYEGIPNTLIEALAVGVPTVSTDCTPGGPNFLTDNGQRGLLVPVDNIEAMSSAICSVIEDSQLAKRLCEKGKEISHILSKERITTLWIDFFNSVIM